MTSVTMLLPFFDNNRLFRILFRHSDIQNAQCAEIQQKFIGPQTRRSKRKSTVFIREIIILPNCLCFLPKISACSRILQIYADVLCRRRKPRVKGKVKEQAKNNYCKTASSDARLQIGMPLPIRIRFFRLFLWNIVHSVPSAHGTVAIKNFFLHQ